MGFQDCPRVVSTKSQKSETQGAEFLAGGLYKPIILFDVSLDGSRRNSYMKLCVALIIRRNEKIFVTVPLFVSTGGKPAPIVSSRK